MSSNNLNRARKVVASSSQNIKSKRIPQNFRRDKKEISFDKNIEVVSNSLLSSKDTRNYASHHDENEQLSQHEKRLHYCSISKLGN